jgi:hypothetical protein
MAIKVDPVAAGMSRSDKKVTNPEDQAPPRTGDRYRCDQCGMELEVVADCAGGASGVHLECCGQELTRLPAARNSDAARDAGQRRDPNAWQG